MSESSRNCKSTVIPGFRYRNAPAAIEWLCGVFGFEKHAVYANPDGTIAHAELTFEGGMIMLGSVKRSEYDQLMKQPDEIGKANTHSVNLITSDPDAVYARAKAAGAEIVFDIEDKGYGGRAFTCRDPEGYIWGVGSYDPWQSK
ncbi:MAG: VOC family protein [Acidobacteriaceae bacterium]|nr:VOC family protein [Acidobacteriaceae bacterium]